MQKKDIMKTLNLNTHKHRGCFSSHVGHPAYLSFLFASLERAWPQRPITDCSAFYPMRGGGMIDFTGATTSPSLYDCVWVIKRQSSDNRADGVVLRLTEVLLGDGMYKVLLGNNMYEWMDTYVFAVYIPLDGRITTYKTSLYNPQAGYSSRNRTL